MSANARRILFFDREISRDEPRPAPVDVLDFSRPMFAMAYLTDEVGPQEDGGKQFRCVLYVRQVGLPEGAYTPYAKFKQEGAVFRPQLSKARSEIVLCLNEDFGDSLQHKLDPGEYEFQIQCASEKGTGNLDVTLDWKNGVAYVQELRKAGYLTKGTVRVVKE